jgi:two-component system, cell cycle response regulator DivK
VTTSETDRLALLVDDSVDILDAYAEILRGAGFDVLTASSGARALDVAFERKPDVIVIDLWMPGMDGFETARALKADPRTKGTPVLGFTSLGYSTKKAEEAGCDLVLRKTAPAEQFVNTIRKLVTEKPVQR